MQCPYLEQNLTKTIALGFLGGAHSGGWLCGAKGKTKLTNSYCDQVCKQNNAHNCMNCNYHPVQH